MGVLAVHSSDLHSVALLRDDATIAMSSRTGRCDRMLCMSLEIRRATIDDLDRAADVLGAAFADYAWTRWTIDSDDHVRLVTALQRLALTTYGLPYGEVWVGLVDARIECVAIWMQSDVEIPETVHAGVAETMVALLGDREEASRSAEAQLSDWRPQRRHRFLGTIGTTPVMQRCGLAKSVIEPVLTSADANGLAAFLETSAETNVAFYRRFGFEVIGHRVIDGGGPDVWAMLREPQ